MILTEGNEENEAGARESREGTRIRIVSTAEYPDYAERSIAKKRNWIEDEGVGG